MSDQHTFALAILIALGIAYFGVGRLWGMWLGDERPAMTITTIEGRRHVTKGLASIEQYGRVRRSMVSRRTWVGRQVGRSDR